MSKLVVRLSFFFFHKQPGYSNWHKASLFEEDKHFTLTLLNHKPQRGKKIIIICTKEQSLN